MRIIKSIIIAMVILITITEVKAADPLDELSAAFKINLKINAIMSIYSDIMQDTLHIDTLSDALIEGDITEDYAIQHGTSIIQSIRAKLERVNEAYNHLPTIPDFADTGLTNRLRVTMEYLRTLNVDVPVDVQLSEDLFIAALEGDASVADKLYEKQLNRTIATLHSEIRSLFQFAATLEKTHPNYELVNVVIYINESIIDLIGGIQRLNNDTDSLINAVNYSRSKLINAELSVNQGRRLLIKTINKYANYDSKDNKERNAISILLEMLESLDISFNVEEQIINIIYGWTDILEIISYSDTALTNSEMQFESTMIELQSLIDTRMMLQQDRSRLGSQF